MGTEGAEAEADRATPDSATAEPYASLEGRAHLQQSLAQLNADGLPDGDVEPLLREAAQLVVDVLGVAKCSVLELLPIGQLARTWVSAGSVRSQSAGRSGGTQQERPGGSSATGSLTGEGRSVFSYAADDIVGRTVRRPQPTAVPDLSHSDVAVPPALLQGSAVLVTSLPGYEGEGPVGLIAAYSESPRAWNDADLEVLSEVAGVVGRAVTRSVMRRALQHQSRLTQLLTEVLTTFVHLTQDGLDDSLNKVLAEVGSYLGADRGSVYLRNNEGDAFECSHVWQDSAKPRPPEPDAPVPMTSSMVEHLAVHEYVHVPDVTQLADDVAAGRDELLERGVRSVIALRMLVDQELLGFVSFVRANVAPALPLDPWSDDLAQALRPMGDAIGAAVARHRIAGELRASEARFRNFVDDVSDVIVRIGPDGALTFVNRAWTELTGKTPAQTIGQGSLENVHPDDREFAMAHMDAVVQGKDLGRPEVRFLAHDGSPRWMEVTVRILQHPDGSFAGFAGSLHDVTDRKEAELREAAARVEAELARDQAELAREEAERARQEAELARDVAERASRAKSEFLSRMSHELRTPLNAILGFTQLLQFSELSEEDTENVEHILNAGRHLLNLINEVLDIARIESGHLALSLEPVSVGQVVSEAVGLVRGAAAERDISIEISTSLSGYEVIADRQRLRQVLVNLLFNAVKYNRDGGSIDIRCEPAPPGPHDAPRLRFSVADTGVGIAPDRLADVFTPFERLGAEMTTIEGTGIGLSLTKTMVEAMDGEIGLTSEPEEGSVFHFDLPRGNSLPEIEHVASPDAPEDAWAWAATVVYIEDNPPNVTLVRRILARRPGVRLLVAGDGRTGLELIRRVRPAFVLLDLHVPVLDGESMLEQLRADDDLELAATPVTVITADLSAGTERRLLHKGATYFLGKPVDVYRLLEITDEELRKLPGPSEQ